VYTMR